MGSRCDHRRIRGLYITEIDSRYWPVCKAQRDVAQVSGRRGSFGSIPISARIVRRSPPAVSKPAGTGALMAATNEVRYSLSK